jgi:RNA polymerase sigma-70 factor (ECF subfamily)
MSGLEQLAERFEEHRNRLQAVAYRMLGSLDEAEDAVQETWLRLSRSEAEKIENLGGWLTTVVSRVCLDMLRARKAKQEQSLDALHAETIGDDNDKMDPEKEALLAESVGLALLVVLNRLNPMERIAYVLHDIFELPFTDIASILGKSEAAARQLASRARRRIRGGRQTADADLARQRELVDAFLSAAYAGDFKGLLNVLDPNVVLRDDRATGVPRVARGAKMLARQVSGRARAAQPALVDGSIGLVAAPGGRLLYIIRFTFRHGKIAEVDLISNPERIRRLDLAVLE